MACAIYTPAAISIVLTFYCSCSAGNSDHFISWTSLIFYFEITTLSQVTIVENGTTGHVNGSNGLPPISSYDAKYSGNRATLVLGAQWGDEGKGKLVDLLATQAEIVCRCQVSYPLKFNCTYS